MFITAIATWTELDYKSLILKISQLLALIQAKCTVALGKLELSWAGELLHLYAPARGLPALITDDGELNLLLHNNRGVKFPWLRWDSSSDPVPASVSATEMSLRSNSLRYASYPPV